MLFYLRGTSTRRPDNILNIRNLLWLSRRLIICTEQTSIYVSTFPTTLTSGQAHEIRIYFSTNVFVASHTAITDNSEIQNSSPLMPDEDKNFGGPLV